MDPSDVDPSDVDPSDVDPCDVDPSAVDPSDVRRLTGVLTLVRSFTRSCTVILWSRVSP